MMKKKERVYKLSIIREIYRKKSSCSCHTTTSDVMSKTNNKKKNTIKKREIIKH
jgi:hypothetical protein